jgi:hypothetical protein
MTPATNPTENSTTISKYVSNIVTSDLLFTGDDYTLLFLRGFAAPDVGLPPITSGEPTEQRRSIGVSLEVA